MSRIRANKITNKAGTGAVELEKGAHLPTGIGITGAGSINVSGVITASSFSGSGAGLTGIDSTALKDSGGNIKVQAQASGAVYTGIHTFSTVNTTHVTGNGSGLTNINASNISSGTIASARVPTLNQNTTGSAASAGTVDVANGSSNTNYYPVFTDNNGTAKTLSIDSNASLAYNPSTNVLTSGTFKGKGTVEVHSYSIDSAGDVGSTSNWFSFSMTPSIDWNKCIWGHSGAHRASADTHYYAGYQFNKGGGDVDQHMRGVGRAQSATNHNQGWAATGTAMESNGTFMSGSANVGCTLKCYSSSGGNSAPANDNGHDHHAWVMFVHD